MRVSHVEKDDRPSKGAQAGERLAQALLECILGVFLVVEQGEDGPIEPACVGGEETLLGISIPSNGLLDDGPLFAPVLVERQCAQSSPAWRQVSQSSPAFRSAAITRGGGADHGPNIR